MEFKKILKILWKDKGLIFGTTVLAVVSSLFFSLIQPAKYQIHLDIETKRINRPQTQDFQYDDYYAIQAASLVTDTINSWFRNESIARKIMTEAGFSVEKLPSLQKFVRSRKLSPQNLEIRISSDSKKTSMKLANIIKEMVAVRVARLNIDEEGQPTFKALINQGPVSIKRIELIQALGAGFIGGLFLGIFLALVFYYFKK